MILEIKIDTSADAESSEDLGMTDQTIYAEVAGVNVSEGSIEYTLRFCPIICDAFHKPPILARLTIWDNFSANLYMEYEEPEESGLNHMDIHVTAKTVQGFPKAG